MTAPASPDNDGSISKEQQCLAESLTESFEILEQIGRGGMSTVYRAINKKLDIEVAVKVLSAELEESGSYRERFINEAKYCSQLVHPNIVQIKSFGFDKDERPYIVMELLHGITLAKLLEEKNTLSPHEFAEVFLPVLDGLVYAHDHKLIHRDLKPANIFLCDNVEGARRVVILDFGIAKKLSFASDTTGNTTTSPAQQLTSGLLGSPLYMSPEQCAGLQADYRSDIYSLACMMFQAIEGHAPFESETAYQTMYRRMNETCPSFSALAAQSEFSKKLLELILSALNKDPDLRPKSATQFWASLKSALQEPAASKKLEMKRWKMLAVATILIFCVLGIASSIYSKKKQKPFRPNPMTYVYGKVKESKSFRTLAFGEAEGLRESGHLKEAAEKYKELLRQFKDQNRHDSQYDQFKCHKALAETYIGLNMKELACEELRKAIAIYELYSSPHRMEAVIQYVNLMNKMGKKEDAFEYLRNAIAAAKKELEGINAKPLADAIGNLGKMEALRGHPKEAITLLEESVSMFENTQSDTCSTAAVTWAFVLYDLYKKQGRQKIGKQMLDHLVHSHEVDPPRAPGAMFAFAHMAMNYPELRSLAIEEYSNAAKYANRDDTPGEYQRIFSQSEAELKKLGLQVPAEIRKELPLQSLLQRE